MSMEHTRKFIKNDEWETPIEYWLSILDYIPKGTTIYDPFYMNNHPYDNWTKLGFQCIHRDEDFFFTEPPEECIIISSPPFSLRNQVLRRLIKWNKPFIMLMPITTLCYIKTQPIIKNKIQLIIPNIYKGFIDKKGEGTRCPPFYLGYFCYKMGLDKDITYL
jgi:hypothetical protein